MFKIEQKHEAQIYIFFTLIVNNNGFLKITKFEFKVKQYTITYGEKVPSCDSLSRKQSLEVFSFA